MRLGITRETIIETQALRLYRRTITCKDALNASLIKRENHITIERHSMRLYDSNNNPVTLVCETIDNRAMSLNVAPLPDHV